MWKSYRLSFKSPVLRLDWMWGFPERHGLAGAVFCRLAVTSHLPSHAQWRAQWYTHAATSQLALWESFSRTCVPRFVPILWVGWGPHPFPLSQRPRATSDPLKILQQCAHWRWSLHGLLTCLYSSVGKSSLCVVATADGALLFPDVLCAVWVRVLGRLKQTNKRGCGGGEKLAKGDIGSL